MHRIGKPAQPTAQVFVIDDDEGVRDSLSSLFRSVAISVTSCSSTDEFLQIKRPDAPGCLVLDVRLPEISGLDFQQALEGAGSNIPIVFMSGHADVPMTVRAMKAGAVEFLTKPFRDQDLIEAVQTAIQRDRERRDRERALSKLRGAFQTLTHRERDVVTLVVRGLMNKQIAAELEISEITVKVHRGSAMRKMGARSLAELVRMVDAVGNAETTGAGVNGEGERR
jgi:FixJ family two-component response regulator